MEMRVIGAPRAGTNLLKYLVETNSDVRCYFNLGWWKHAIVPPYMNPHQTPADQTPTVIMCRDPIRHLVSLYRFSQKGRTAIRGAPTFDAFISSPIYMVPPEQLVQYAYSSPIEYLYQFYYAALKWANEEKLIISLEDLQKDPNLALRALTRLFPNAEISPHNVDTPELYLGRNGDSHVTEAWGYDTQYSLTDENSAAETIVGGLTQDQRSEMLPSHLHSVFAEIEACRFAG